MFRDVRSLVAFVIVAGCGHAVTPASDASPESSVSDGAPRMDVAVDAIPVDVPMAIDALPPVDAPTASDQTAPDANPPVDAPPDSGVTPCRSDRECSALSLVCDRTRGICVQCNTPTDCAAGQVCSGGMCRTIVHCTSSRMCPGQVCDMTMGVCVDCVTDIDCPTGTFCAPDASCHSPVCTAGTTQCQDPTHLETCTANGSGWNVTACSCSLGRCATMVCVPGATSCAGPSSVRTCNPDGLAYTTTPCGGGQGCAAGMCSNRVCTPGSVSCDRSGTAVNTCNADGLSVRTTACPAMQGCLLGACVAQVCRPGTSNCVSFNTQRVCDANGLGYTDTMCGPGQGCGGGGQQCFPGACMPGTSSCPDMTHFRVCAQDSTPGMPQACPMASTCAMGVCSGSMCAPGAASCASPTSRRVCNPDGATFTTTACPTPAHATPSCGGAGVCAFTCAAGFADCDGNAANGCEADLTAPGTCGSCANRCGTGATCASGQCACPTGTMLCGGACRNVNSDVLACGTCGNSCPSTNATPSCMGGTCSFACQPGFGDCNGNVLDACETDFSAPTDCGACHNACTVAPAHASPACVNRACGSVCDTGFADCDGNAANGCETNVDATSASCGSCSHACPAMAMCVAGWCSQLASGLGGADGFGTNALDLADDSSSAAIDLSAAFPHGFNYFGNIYSIAYVNNNGNISFRAPFPGYTPAAFPVASLPIIAPWWADVDTRGAPAGTHHVYWAVQPGEFIATWNTVGYFNQHEDKLNSFQLVLRDRSDVAPGDFDVEFRYARCEWTTGDASGGMAGLGGTAAQAGFDAGDQRNFLALPGSMSAGILNLCMMSNINQRGIWRYLVRDGRVM